MSQFIAPTTGNQIIFDNNLDITGTSLIGYFYPTVAKFDISALKDISAMTNLYTPDPKRQISSFLEMTARFYGLLGKNIFVPKKQQDKIAVEIILSYQGHMFTIYDYKGDGSFHIGGHENSKDLISDLAKDLDEILLLAQPMKFKHKSVYGNLYYRYK